MTRTKSIKTQMFHIIFWQLMVIMGLAVILFLLQGMQRGISFLLGGLAYWLPTLIFIWRVTAHTGAQAATRFIVAVFTWETVKLILSGVLFLFIVNYLSVQVFYALVGFMVAIVAFWIASFVSLYREGA